MVRPAALREAARLLRRRGRENDQERLEGLPAVATSADIRRAAALALEAADIPVAVVDMPEAEDTEAEDTANAVVAALSKPIRST